MNDKINFLVMDVDGTLTDGNIYMGSHGELFKAFDIKDGCGIKEILPKYNIIPVIITARENKALEHRCNELGIRELHQGCREKLEKLKEVISQYSVSQKYDFSNVAYIGDDLLDLQCMLPVKQAGGLAVCPSNAIKEIRDIADYICLSRCGEGAVREFIDWLTLRQEDSKLEYIYKISPEAYSFIKNFQPSVMEDGRYQLESGVFADVMSYITKPAELTCYESHKKHIDIQYLIYGTELMVTEDVRKLQNYRLKEYCDEQDVIFYKYNLGNARILEPGESIILHPNDARRGAIAVKQPIKVRKIVVKIPV